MLTPFVSQILCFGKDALKQSLAQIMKKLENVTF